jgi:hypothetical protein
MAALSQADKQELKDLIKDAINDGQRTYSQEVELLMSRLRAHGEGNLEKGIESFAKTLSMFTRIRKFGETVGGTTAVWLVKVLLTGLLALLVLGAAVKLGKLP